MTARVASCSSEPGSARAGGGDQVPGEHPGDGEDREERADQTHDDRAGRGGLGPAGVLPPRILGNGSAPAPNSTAAAANTSAHQP